VGACLIGAPTLYLTPQAIAALPWLRLLTGTKTLGLLLWLGCGAWLMRAPALEPSGAGLRLAARANATDPQ
jgi:hypothetical protein